MPRWTYSLQFRLIAGFGLALALAIAGVSAYAAAATRAETERFTKEVEESRAARVEQLVQRAYEANRDWDQVRYTIAQAADLLGWRVVMYDGDGAVIADSHQDTLRAAGVLSELESQIRFRPRIYRRPIIMGNRIVGMMLVVDQGPPESHEPRRSDPRFFRPGPRPDNDPRTQPAPAAPADGQPARPVDAAIAEQLAPEPRLSQLESSFRRSLVLAGGAAGAAGILLVGLFTRQALAPVRGLTGAARRLGKGDLAYRVPARRRDEVGELARTFNEMAAGLEEAAHQRRAMTADIAHELRTPLTNIQGYLEAIKDGVVQPDAETINVLHDQTVHLSRLVEDLRLLAIADAGRLQLDLRPERLDLVAEDAVAAFRPRAAEHRIGLEVVVPAPAPLVELDRTRMRQVIQNLVENALTHTPDGGQSTVSVGPSSPGQVILTVADSGRGIPKEQLARIFDQFYRVDPSRSRSTGGAGLGLTIVKRLVEAHAGTVHAESEIGQGARFVISLPASQAVAG